MYLEINFDGLVGPSHNYAGLAMGNNASQRHKNTQSNPQAAALQGLEKMHWVASQGIKQGILLPAPRPHLQTLRELGFSEPNLINQCVSENPQLLNNIYSASSMWAANSATVSPSCHSQDQKVHFSVANLSSHLHRSIEAQYTNLLLRWVFNDNNHFVHHGPLPTQYQFSDEGAANHNLILSNKGPLELFVYNRDGDEINSEISLRQSKLASQAIIRRHKLKQFILEKQSLKAVKAGVFHNDVIAIGYKNLFICHEHSFENQSSVIKNLESLGIDIIEIKEHQLSLKDAVTSYFFNSQIIEKSENHWIFLLPSDCEEIENAKNMAQEVLEKDNAIKQVVFKNVKQSMFNGGGPACLRFRVPLTDIEIAQVNPNVWLTQNRYEQLKTFITDHYPTKVTPSDLQNPDFAQRCLTVHKKLCNLFDFEYL